MMSDGWIALSRRSGALRGWLAMAVCLGAAGLCWAQSPRQAGDDARLQLVRDYADRVLEAGRDRYSGRDTPLLVDGVHVHTGEPVAWRFNDETFIIHNLASQQNLFRVLVGLSNLTGETRYKEAAKTAIAYHFDHLASECGLLRWGGHQFINLATLEPVGHFDANCHELKHSFPFYELMWEVNAEATARYVRAFWNAHVADWDVLDMNRHGAYGKAMGALWENRFGHPEPFYEGAGLSFINAGSDLIYAAGMLYGFNGEEGALRWAKNMASLYRQARHPQTGLGVYQYSKPHRLEPPPEGPLEGHLTNARFGDRAENQFGGAFGEVAREGWVMWGSRVSSIYSVSGMMQLKLGEAMGEQGRELIEWTADGLEALARHAYDAQQNAFRPMWADGTDLTGRRYPRTGYYGEEGTWWRPERANARFVMVYATAYRLTGREIFWQTARQMASGLGWGEIGSRPGEEVELAEQVRRADAMEIFALLELHRAGPNEAYLERARRVADAMIERHWHHGFFMASDRHVHADFNRVEPLAILALEAALRGQPELTPMHIHSRGYIHGRFDGHGRTTDATAIWSVLEER